MACKTRLTLCLLVDDLGIVKLLWRNRKNKFTEGEDVRKAIDLAKQQGRDAIMKFLEEESVAVSPPEEASQSHGILE